jgi:hypothetical protein
MSSSCGLRGGSWGTDSAAGSCESVNTFCSVANSGVENTGVSFGRFQICVQTKVNSRFDDHGGTSRHTSMMPCGRTRMRYCPAFPELIACSVEVAPFNEAAGLRHPWKSPVLSRKKHPGMYRDVCIIPISGERPEDRATMHGTLSPIGDISLRLIFPRSVSPINNPIESSSRKMST